MRYTALAVAAVAAALSIPAVAQEAAPAPICAETMEHVISMIEAKGGEYISLTGVELVAFAERVAPITGVPAGEVTGALIVEFGGVRYRDEGWVLFAGAYSAASCSGRGEGLAAPLSSPSFRRRLR